MDTVISSIAADGNREINRLMTIRLLDGFFTMALAVSASQGKAYFHLFGRIIGTFEPGKNLQRQSVAEPPSPGLSGVGGNCETFQSDSVSFCYPRGWRVRRTQAMPHEVFVVTPNDGCQLCCRITDDCWGMAGERYRIHISEEWARNHARSIHEQGERGRITQTATESRSWNSVLSTPTGSTQSDTDSLGNCKTSNVRLTSSESVGLRLWQAFKGSGKFKFVVTFNPSTLACISKELKPGDSEKFATVWKIPADLMDFHFGLMYYRSQKVAWYDLAPAVGRIRSSFATPDGIGATDSAKVAAGETFDLGALEIRMGGVTESRRSGRAPTRNWPSLRRQPHRRQPPSTARPMGLAIRNRGAAGR